MTDLPSTAAEWFEHLRAQLRGEAEPVEDTTSEDHPDENMHPPRKDWQ